MIRSFCKSKIVNAVITKKDLNYSGSIGIDKAIMESADIMPGEQVHVLDSNNGNRFVTYVIEEQAKSGNIILYGPAARLGEPGDGLVILSFCFLETKESYNHKIRSIKLGDGNQVKGEKK